MIDIMKEYIGCHKIIDCLDILSKQQQPWYIYIVIQQKLTTYQETILVGATGDRIQAGLRKPNHGLHICTGCLNKLYTLGVVLISQLPPQESEVRTFYSPQY